MSVETLTRSVTLQVIECGTCGVIHAIPQSMYDQYYKDGGFWHCPNGHRRGWNERNCKSALEKLEAENARLTSSINYKNDQIDTERRRTAAAKGEVNKIKKRIGNGICPCCNRTFANLQRHMTTKHLDFKEEEV
jgi:hypothetical protein